MTLVKEVGACWRGWILTGAGVPKSEYVLALDVLDLGADGAALGAHFLALLDEGGCAF